MLNTSHPLTDGLQGFWLPAHGRAGGSRLYDLSAYKRNGSFVNISPSAWTQSSDQSFPVIDFPGTAGNRIEPSWTGVLGTTPYSVVIVAKHDTAADQTLTDWGDAVGTGNVATFRLDETSSGNWVQRHEVGGGFARASTNTKDGLWHTLGMSFSGGDVVGTDFYFDGGRSPLDSSSSQAVDIQGRGDVFIGGRKGTVQENFTARPFAGGIAACLIWSRSLSASEQEIVHDQARRGFPDLLRTRSDVGLLGGGGGGTIVTVSEAAALAARANLQATDTALSSESAALSATGTPTATDSATATEQASIGSAAMPSATETATITEAVTLAATATWSITETVGSAVTEAATLAVTTSLSATETATATESAQVSSQVTLAAQEAATASEALQLETEARLNAQEAITVTEAAQIQVEAALDLIEEGTTTEAVKIAAVATWSVTETAGKLITGRISEVGRNTVQLLSRPFNKTERKDG